MIFLIFTTLFLVCSYFLPGGSACDTGYTGPNCSPCTAGRWGVDCANYCHCSVPCSTDDGRCAAAPINGRCTGNYAGYSCQQCTTGYWGTYCNQQCNCQTPCDQSDGSCHSSCTDNYAGSSCQQCLTRYWGSTCTNRCYCAGGCDKSTGVCSGACDTGYTGSQCTSCATYYKSGSGDTCVACNRDEWGTRCQNTCQNCQNGCYSSSGNCRPGGCITGYTGNKCTSCASYYKRSDGNCVPCDDDEWGTECQNSCANCQSGCDSNNGQCDYGGCITGYTGSHCTSCANYYKQGSGSTCVPCDGDEWGTNCQNSCPISCHSGCYNSNGNCDSRGCITGYTGNQCTSCANYYKSGSGNTCAACDSNEWGTSCQNNCLYCQNGCNNSNGYCRSGGCIAGYAGNKCTNCANFYKQGSSNTCVPCDDDEWGTSCQNSCPSNCRGGCQNTNGNCDSRGCITGYTGNQCTNCASYYKRGSSNTCVACNSDEWGTDCQYDCPNCRYGCHNSNGNCRSGGCITGYTGNQCTSCASYYKHSSNNCVPCDDDEWGTDCQNTCSNCLNGCISSSGTCNNGGCISGYTGSHCTSCANYYKQGSGSTCVPCGSSEWGTRCQSSCNTCRRGCQNHNGRCNPGGCINAGYIGDSCENCATGYRRSGTACVVCSDGYYGDNCANECHCSVSCDHRNGNCPSTCDAGYSGDPCMPCNNGRFGVDCAINCHCSALCDRFIGLCDGSCWNAYRGASCQECKTGYVPSTSGNSCVACDNGLWGESCARQCHCSRVCNNINGVCGALCDNGYYGVQCQNTCTQGTWGAGDTDICRGNCNCADPSEVCRTTDGHCDSGCADWYTSTGCDYEMPRLGVGEIPHILHINGRNVNVQFHRWRQEFGGTGTVSHYKIEYSALDNDVYATLSPYRFDHVSTGPMQRVNITLPDIRTNYTIRIVPYESSEIYTGPGEPSADIFLYTECADGWFGQDDCNQQCNCADVNDICNKTNGTCEGCYMGYLGSDCQIEAPTLQEQSVDINWQDKDIMVTFDKISDTNDYSLSYVLEFRLKGESNWQTVMINTNRQKRSTVPRQLLPANSEYECRIVPVFYDRQRNQYTRGQTSAVHYIVTGCETPSDVSQFYPSACEHWCECGEDEYCLLTSGYCNGLCDAQCTRLPNKNNTEVVITTDIESMNVYIINNGTNVQYYTLAYSEQARNKSLRHNITNIAGSTITGLSPNTAYSIMIYPFAFQDDEVYVSPAIIEEVKTLPTEKLNTAIIIGVVIALLLLIAVAVCILVYFLIIRKKRRNKHKSSDNEKDYYNLTSTNVPITTVNGCEYAEAKPTKAANTDLYANDAAITKAAADASKKPKLAVKPATKSKPIAVASGTCSVDEFIKKWSKIPDAQLEDDYKAIPENKEATSERGDLKVNYEKHRFNNIKAYDHSRVVLDKLEDDPYSDYVNAAFITGYGGTEKAFVASQGPRKPTIGDMWRLIWKINTNLIVMLTNLLENKKIKCKQYWPDDQARFYHGIQVETLETKNYAFYTRRLFLVKKEDETRQITHMQFTQWPDHGVPETPNELMEFFFIVQSMEPSLKGPLMVHCSAGVGRTGTFIALDYLLKQAAAEDAVDVCACVKELRKNRCQMVQTPSQYVFLHKALRQTLISKPSSIKMEAFIPSIVESDDYTTKLVDQYNRLNKIRPKALDATTAKSRENIEKNSDPSVLADDKHRVKLTTAVDGCTDYIQAVKCGTYTQTDALVLTQIPLKHTIADIWRLCHETTVCSIITLEGEVAVPYWPQELEKSDLYGPLEVTFNSESSTNYQGVTVRNFTLKKDSKKNCTKIKQWHVHTAGERGEEGGEETIHAWLHVYEQARNWKLSDSSASSTVLIQCRDGAQRSGAFAAMWSILEKLEAESVVDVDFAIRRVRQCRPQAVVSDQQYQMLYDIVKVYLEDRQTGYYNA